MTTKTDDNKTLRERIAENPQPAIRWGGVFAVLFLLELAHYAAGVQWIAGVVKTGLSGATAIPWFIGNNVDSAITSVLEWVGVGELLGTPAVVDAASVVVGLLFVGLTALAMLYLGVVISLWITGRSVLKYVGIEAGSHVSVRGQSIEITDQNHKRIERATLTVLFAIMAVFLMLPPVAAVVDVIIGMIGRVVQWVASLPHLTSPEIISNQGYQSPDGWEGTFLGLSAAVAWAIRVVVVYAYTLILLYWLWKGYNIYRRNYRRADWAPTDDWIRRFSSHTWGVFGFVMIFAFVVMAAWAHSLATYPVSHNIYEPFQHEVQYWAGEGVETISHGEANSDTRSDGGDSTVTPMSYDQYDRWAPLGTTRGGNDLWTFLVYGARTSLIIGITAIGLGALIAVTLSMITAYYKGIVDTLTIITTDTIISIPAFLFVLLLLVLFGDADHPIAEPMNGGLLLALAFAFVYWPGMWRAIRGPSLQVAEQEWVDAAKSYGQNPFVTMRKHMAPYIAGYLMIYASLLLGSIIIATAALSFLGIGIEHPTPEWGRLVSEGEVYINTSAWHVATVPGFMIVLVVTGFNALGDGIRDAIDPESNVESGEGGAVGGGGA